MRINHLLIAAFSRLFLSAFAFPASLPTAIERSDGARAEQLTTLHPGLHPDEDASDLDNLKANKESSLYYTASPDSKRQGAGVLQLTHLYPAVSLERSEFISSVTCNSASTIMTVTFKDTSSFQTALADWSQHHTGFLLISYIAGCGTGVDSSERSFHLISGISASNKDLQIFCQMKTIPIHDTVHEEQEMRFSVVTYSLKNLTPPTKRSNTTHDLSPRGTLQEGYKVAKTVLGIFNPLAVTALELLERIEFNSHETINTEQFTTSSLKPFDSTFDGKPAYKLLHLAYDGKSSAKKPASTDPKADNDDGTKTSGTIAGAIKNGSTASLDLFCVNCGLGMTLHYTGNFVGSYKKGFSEANMEVTADITATLVLGIEAQYEYDLADKELFSVDKAIPNAGIEIPKVLKIGTFIVFVVEANFNVKLHGLVSFGYICTWKGVGAKLDFKDSSQSKVLGDWSLEANCKQEKSFNVELTVKFTPVVKLSLKVEIALFQGFTDKLATSVSLVEKLSLPLTAAFSTQPFKDCKAREIGVEAELVSDLYVIATAAKKSTDPFSLVDFKIPLYKNCFEVFASASPHSIGDDPRGVPQIGNGIESRGYSHGPNIRSVERSSLRRQDDGGDASGADSADPADARADENDGTPPPDSQPDSTPASDATPGAGDNSGSSQKGETPPPADSDDNTADAYDPATEDTGAAAGASGDSAAEGSSTDSSSNSAQAPGDSDAEGSRGAGDSDSGAAVDSDPDSAETRIIWADEGYTLDWAPDGTVVVKNADDLYEGWTSVDAITTIASGGQFLHTAQSTATTGIGRLAVANPVPPDSNQIYLGKPTTGAFLLATDGKDVYYLVYCDYGEQRREVFLVLDPSTALAILEADTSSGEVEFCAFAFFTQEITPAST